MNRNGKNNESESMRSNQTQSSDEEMNRNGKNNESKSMRSNQTQSSDEEHISESQTFTFCKYKFCHGIICSQECSLYCSLKCEELESRIKVLTGIRSKLRKRNQLPPHKKCSDWTEMEIVECGIHSSTEESDHDDTEPIVKVKILFNYVGNIKSVENLPLRCAPKDLFDKPFPTDNNLFHVQQKLEGINPKSEKLFCVMTVVEVCGYRIKLHFDGCSKEYDFWVNADCPNLFYSKWCNNNLRSLQPPKNVRNAFNWDSYLQKNCAEAAPEWNFASNKNLATHGIANQFCIGHKLEALIKGTRVLDEPIIQIATVVDILGDRIRLHFDGLTDDFDYWTDIKSTNIHPANWCQNNGRSLTLPKSYIWKSVFSWPFYLKDTKSKSVPEDAFIYCPIKDFSIHMIIEVVDIMVPSVIRNAYIVNVRRDVIEIVYEGFERTYSYWIEDDSPDIHPVGWCKKTNHPIEKPENRKLWNCKVVGCNGKYNLNGTATHKFAKNCPYQWNTWIKVIESKVKLYEIE